MWSWINWKIGKLDNCTQKRNLWHHSYVNSSLNYIFSDLGSQNKVTKLFYLTVFELVVAETPKCSVALKSHEMLNICQPLLVFFFSAFSDNYWCNLLHMLTSWTTFSVNLLEHFLIVSQISKAVHLFMNLVFHLLLLTFLPLSAFQNQCSALWKRIYMAEFNKNKKQKPKSMNEPMLKVEVEDHAAGYWKSLYFKTSATYDMEKWKRHLGPISCHTGLPGQTERVLRCS